LHDDKSDDFYAAGRECMSREFSRDCSAPGAFSGPASSRDSVIAAAWTRRRELTWIILPTLGIEQGNLADRAPGRYESP
jgi:hypothetical protein